MMTREERVSTGGSARSRSWHSLLQPSFSDLFFLFVLVWLFLAGETGWQRLLFDADTAFHTRIGQEILANASVPTTDPFSFSKPGGPWYAFEWLSETVFAALYNLAGWKGIVLFAGVLIAGYLTALYRYALWLGASGMIALVLTLVTCNATSIHYLARPHLFTFLLLLTAVWLLADLRRNGRRRVWLVVPLTALWANLHGGFAIFFVLLGLRCAGCGVEAWLWPEIRSARRGEAVKLAILGAACGVASMVNPYGIHLHLHIIETLRSSWITTHVHEFGSPSFRSEALLQFMLILFAGLAITVPLLRKRRVVEVFWILFLAYASLISVRHTTIFLLVVVPLVAAELSDWWRTLASAGSPQSLAGVLDDISEQLTRGSRHTSLFIPAAVVILAVAPQVRWPTAFPEVNVPVKFVEKHKERLATARLYTSDQNADYLIYLNYPRQRVFIDSRHNYYGDRIGNDYVAIGAGMPRWRDLLDRYEFDAVLSPVECPLASLLRLSGGWRVVDEDGANILFERTPRQPIIKP